ncbi:hypothetical protein [Methylococcus sp. Mc7]|uniref:hypothetical protein n=2 Tax=unclassified Methylococcus TaxID=2618889 RepID=UPI002103DD52|nr:hypothetical protein [Methylococcus sp. Mc7]
MSRFILVDRESEHDATDRRYPVRVRPGTRFDHRAVDGLYFELEGGVEYMTKPVVLNERDTKRYYVDVGYRWDF